ncbi:amino acid adenylation domain-containing protein [Nonomuraea sp. SBT364]|uniref:amino acid adenylation domain-containing protein n=1 Tax=Nonomuraea sp. SBT364 TaxID=1580530 RepID=UPI00066B888B|nr:amino acid adenylation domain-containing protein [Nonomuraea sp. SBT364]
MTTLCDLVRAGAERTPEALAVSAPDGDVGYGRLDAMSNQLAHVLAARGVRRGDRVAIWLDKSVWMVAAMQAVLRLGAAYVPVDPLGPAGRAAAVIADCRPRVLVTTPVRARSLPATPGVALLTGWEEVAGCPAGRPDVPPPRPGDLAYILYTSGSTGLPKGVCQSHAGALAFVEWAAGELGARPADRFANQAPPQFDLSVLDLYVAFMAGASVHLVSHEHAYAPERLVAFVREHAITVWYSVPSALMMMERDGELLQAGPLGLRAVLFAGEPYPVAHLRRLRDAWPQVRFLNLYGPTETNVCTFYEVPVPGREVPIGRACSGAEVWVERDDGSRADVGEEGELVVRGPTVMLGYWGRPPQDGAPYRTGDRVVLGADGNLRYRGRRDGMVKVRGHRIELAEVEEVLNAHPAVAEAAATVEGEGLAARLVAWLVPRGTRAPGLLEIKRHCAASLPRYMIIDVVRELDRLPRTATGKMDRLRLAGRTRQA